MQVLSRSSLCYDPVAKTNQQTLYSRNRRIANRVILVDMWKNITYYG